MFLGGTGGVITPKVISDPYSNIDGSPNAPTGTAQYPTLFTGFGGLPSYPVRPPWKVAGVDYRVGPKTGVSYADPATISASIAVPSGSNPTLLTIQQNNVTLDSYDFTLSGGYKIVVSNTSNLVLSNSKFENLFIDASQGPVTIQYCDINGLGSGGETSFGCLAFIRTGVATVWMYNYMYNAEQNVISMSTNDCTCKYNLFDTVGYESGSVPNMIQFAGSGTANNIAIEFNTFVQVQTGTPKGPNSAIELATQIDAGATMNNPVVSYNTAIFGVPGTTSAGVPYRIDQTTGSINGAIFSNNYVDNTNITAPYSATGGVVVTKSGNIILNNGSSF